MQKWTENLPKNKELGLTLAVLIVGKWYNQIEESPNRLARALEFVGVHGAQSVLTSVVECLRLVYGRNSNALPSVLADLLAESSFLVLHALASFWRVSFNQEISFLKDGGISVEMVEANINTILISSIMPASVREAFDREVQVGISELCLHVIGEDVEAHVQSYFDSKEVQAGHPAYEYLTEIVTVAPQTRSLPVRTETMLAAFMNG